MILELEESVGQLWHRLITRAAQSRYPEAQVTLKQMQHQLGVVFRALGGAGGLRVEAAEALTHGARRGLLQRIAGTDAKAELAWRDEQSLRLPAAIDCFADAGLNRELYLWLAALAAGDLGEEEPWLQKNQRLSRLALGKYPGLGGRYRRLAAAHLPARPDPAGLPADEAAQERAIRAALQDPGSVEFLPFARRPPLPVPLWLHPSPPMAASSPSSGDGEGGGGQSKTLEDERRRSAERREMPDGRSGLITIRMENILSWGEFVNADRCAEDEEDLDEAAAAAADAERFAVARDGQGMASKLRFDLDLASAACDDQAVGEGIRLPEWDWKKRSLQPEHCLIQPMMTENAAPAPLPKHLARTAKRLRAQFQQLIPARTWRRGEPDGVEVDLDRYLQFAAARAAGQSVEAEGLYSDLRTGARDLACLLLADLSLSTDTWVDNQHRVIDVIRDSLFLFAESLAATGDRFGLYGFSSRKRDPVRFHQLKGFDQAYNATVRGRIQAIKPGYYTRMGAAVRYAKGLLEDQPAERRLLLLVSDGKPNDLDKYEGRYGVEDTRHAVRQARQAGIQPFCVTVDQKANDYLPYIFGSGGYAVIRRPQDLPNKLPMLYARLTG